VGLVAIAPGPLLVPTTSLLFAGRLIARYGAAPVIAAGIFFFVAGLAFWAVMIGPEPNAAMVIIGMVPTGIGVGLAFPTLMGVGTASLPASSFATGSGVINMIRQAALAIGVAIFVAVVASPASPMARVAAFHRGWWIMAAITALGLFPTLFLIRLRRTLV
jgi:MFS family permease